MMKKEVLLKGYLARGTSETVRRRVMIIYKSGMMMVTKKVTR